jgi:hypothetical protein
LGFPTKLLTYPFLVSTCVLHVPPILSFLIWSFQLNSVKSANYGLFNIQLSQSSLCKDTLRSPLVWNAFNFCSSQAYENKGLYKERNMRTDKQRNINLFFT